MTAGALAYEPQLARSFVDLLHDPALDVTPLVILPHLLVDGRTTLLSAREKVGKTSLASQGVAAYLEGRAFLDDRCAEPGAVLWYAIDEHIRDAQRRFVRLLERPHANLFISDVPRTLEQLTLDMAYNLEQRPEVGVVVVDTLSRAFQSSGIDANKPEQSGPAVRALVDLQRTFNAALLLIYHTNKNGHEYGGNTSIGATVDEVLTMKKRTRPLDGEDFDAPVADDGRRWLVKEGRELRGSVSLAFRDGLYSVGDEPLPIERRVLVALGTEPLSQNALRGVLGVKMDRVVQAVAACRESGHVQFQGNGAGKRLSLTLAGRAALAGNDGKHSGNGAETLGKHSGNGSGVGGVGRPLPTANPAPISGNGRCEDDDEEVIA